MDMTVQCGSSSVTVDMDICLMMLFTICTD